MTAKRRTSVDMPMRVIAWCGVLLGSSLFEIISRECFGGSRWWIGVLQCALLTLGGIAALASTRFRPIGRFLLAVAALFFCWYAVAPRLETTVTVQNWLQHSSWGGQWFIKRALRLTGAALVAFTLIKHGIRRRDTYLQIGDMAAPAQPIPWLGLRRPLPWTIFGPLVLLVFALALSPFLWLTVRPNFANIGSVWRFLPWILAIALLNAANEEFQFRCVLLAHLRNVLAPGEAVLLTAVMFGINHYYGQPSGPIGMVMAGFAGWMWGKSMIETRGFGWAVLIHTVQDIVIFSLMAMNAPK